MSNKVLYDYLVFVGRFQPYHIGHHIIITEALTKAKRVIIGIGSADQPRDGKNPWFAEERETMIRACFTEAENDRIFCFTVQDHLYNNSRWFESVQNSVDTIRGCNETKIGLVGHKKDPTSWYLDEFPQWDYIEMPNYKGYNSTDIRDVYFRSDIDSEVMQRQLSKMPQAAANYMEQFAATAAYDYVVKEEQFIDYHNDLWKDSPFPVSFNCADSAVIQSGHILLIKRGKSPGLDQWALPGGYIEIAETPQAASQRELREETRLKVADPVLRGSQFATHIFDHPNRSRRGRIYSHAFGYELNPGYDLPKVKGSDDAKDAKWFTFAEAKSVEMRRQMFEDHYSIVEYFLARAGKQSY